MSIRTHLERFINHKVTDLTLVVLILLSILLLLLEITWEGTAPDFHYQMVVLLNDIITVLFIVELTIRFVTYRRKRRFFKTYWLDILAVLPVLRPFRILRVLRLLRIFRMGLLINRRVLSVSAVFREGLKEYLIVFFVIIMVVLTGAVSIRVLEGQVDSPVHSFPEAVWWSVLSMISGEPINFTPVTFWGRIIAVVLMIGGLTLFAVFTGVVSAVMVQKLKGGMNVRDVELEELKDHIILCGWNRSASMIIEELQSDKQYVHTPIVVIAEFQHDPDLNFDVVDRNLIYILKDDYTKIDVLKKAGVHKARIAIILPDKTMERSDQDRDARTVLASLIIEKMNNQIFTCVELLNRDNETHLQMAGVEEVVVSDEYAGNIIAAAAKNHGIISVLNELFTSKYGNQFFKVAVPPRWVGKTVMEMFVWLKETYNAVLLSVENGSGRNRNGHAVVNPLGDYRFQDGDFIIVISHEKIELV
ncbi:MAG: ion transporter [Acidobacteria bacterium]|nr:ion transporter [Acidobacteriota bacterium]